ncbi:hypothetical protein [Schlesneria sp. DSM 10557]|uniref:hypothetical protein n=1 Tax=Schlesneria sp. DSM 10557 TaxID=3044399 RepID=UPI0035A0DFE8
MISFPSRIIPSFQKESEANMTFAEVFGKFSLTNLLDKALEKIRAGQFSVRPEAAKELGISTTGTFAQAELAAFIFILECSIKNENCRSWMKDQIPELAAIFGDEWTDLSSTTLNGLWQKFAALSPESPAPQKKNLHGSPGRKRGSHRDGTGHR